MAKKILDGMFAGVGFVVVVAAAFAIAWAGDIFTVDKDGALKFAVSEAGKITVGATESYVNLVIQNDEVAAEADNKVDITADVLTVEGIRLENVNVSANIESSGAGGLDTGTETIDPVNTTWYYVWVITNADGSARNGLLSFSPTSPTLPAGYSRKRRVGAVGNTAVAGNFLQFVQEGNKLYYDESLGTLRPLYQGIATSFTDVVLSNYLPPTSRRSIVEFGSNADGVAPEQSFSAHLRRNGSLAANGSVFSVLFSQATNVFNLNRDVVDVDTDANQTIEYKINQVPASGGVVIDVLGYYDRI